MSYTLEYVHRLESNLDTLKARLARCEHSNRLLEEELRDECFHRAKAEKELREAQAALVETSAEVEELKEKLRLYEGCHNASA